MDLSPLELQWETYGAALAHRARLLRNRIGLTQEELSERSGVSRNMIQNIERGHSTGKPGKSSNPTLKTLYSLCYALQVPPVVLLPDLAGEVQRRSPSVMAPPGLEKILAVDIVWPQEIEVEFPE